jgi:ABC transporter with metal-binding/Fe-S-binding domain ATP-binding protein
MTNACLFSGGKDSTLALHKVINSGIKIDLLITFLSENKFSYMFHYPNAKQTSLQAEALGIKQIFIKTEGKKEEELKDLEKALVENNITLLITGATFSRYQADRIKAITDKHKMENIAPLWHIDPIAELNELSENFDVIISAVAADGLNETHLGRKIDKNLIEELKVLNKKNGINLVFEGGEAESFVLDGPLFKKRIKIIKAKKEWNGERGVFEIQEAVLENK